MRSFNRLLGRKKLPAFLINQEQRRLNEQHLHKEREQNYELFKKIKLNVDRDFNEYLKL